MEKQGQIEKVEELLLTLVPFVLTAGEYAITIQERVASQPAKGAADNPIYDALTDADLAVQSFIEVALLAHYPEVSFFGEEFEKSLNMKYFPESSELSVFLDPIDGTRFYIDNLDTFNVIVAVANADEVLGALLYMPGRDILLSGVKDRGLFRANRAEALSGRGEVVDALQVLDGILITYDFSDTASKFSGDFQVVDVLNEYIPGQGCRSINALFQGECAGVIGEKMSIIDWGAMAFLAGEAGAIVSDFRGRPLPAVSTLDGFMYPEIIVALNEETHSKMLNALEQG